MRIYVTSSFGDDRDTVEYLCSLVKRAGFEDMSFIRDVENYEINKFKDAKELMKCSMEEIEKSDGLLIDMTDKPTGRAIEAGMAYALNKKILVIMKQGTTIKDTTRGIADLIVEYKEIDDIVPALSVFYRELMG